MKCRIRCCFLFVFLVFLSACAPVTMNQFLNDGKKPLSGAQLHELVTDNSLHLEAIDFDAKIQYSSDGQITATSLRGEKDKGKWTISASDELCMKFDRWYFGDQRCYKVFNEQNTYVLFTTNGARYYTGTMLPGNRNVAITQSRHEDSKHGTPSQSVSPAAPLSKEERTHSLISLARNCPDCNFAGVDLRKAQLVAANLAGANLSGADLGYANLRRANLVGANLSGAKLTQTNLAGADLTNCDLSNADLTGSNLIRATVTGAKFDGAILSGAHLESIQGFKE